MKTGIYGGSFNPPHLGHVEAAEKAVEKLGLERLLVFPAGIPPHKELPVGTPDDATRLEMAEIAFSGISCAQVLDYEMVRGGMSYTVNTLRHLKNEYPGDTLYLLLGTDMYETLENWRDSGEIFKLAVPVAFARKENEYEYIRGIADKYLAKYGVHSEIIELNAFEAASSQVRRLLPLREGVEYLNDQVYSYIISRRCYGARPNFKWLREKSYAYHKPGRIPHVKGCEEEAVRLAQRWGGDIDSAREAGILHDITKKRGLAEQLILCDEYGILNDDLENHSEKLLHSKTGAALSKSLFGISDEVYSAIRWHTTGRANMTLLEKILYLADYVEPNRCFEGVEALRGLCYEDLDKAMALGLRMSVEELQERGVAIHPKTTEALEFYDK